MSSKDFNHDFQSYGDLILKDTALRIKKHFSIAFLKTKKLARNLKKVDWKFEISKWRDSYFVSRAIIKGASKKTSTKTLILLGRLRRNKKIQQVMHDNVIKIHGHYLKIDDPNNQAQIRKAIKENNFETQEFFSKSTKQSA